MSTEVQKLKEGMAAFDEAFAELMAVSTELDEIRHKAPEGEWHLHRARIDFAKVKVSSVKIMASKLALALAGLTRGSKLSLPPYAAVTANAGLRGGALLLEGTIFSTRRFIADVEHPDAPSMMSGISASLDWMTLGGVVGLIEKGMRS